ncbi:hypothetical protein [Nocardiopsis sp. NPDC006938]|uniref:hypothetical protein n=1 Tax=Nocardiopsis sp. NPDC006938 TaxID=3364337 RepID=UPI0036B8B768
MTTHTHTPSYLALDAIGTYVDATPQGYVGALLGLTGDQAPLWWSATSGPLEIIAGTGRGKTALAQSVAAQLVRKGEVAEIVIIGQEDEWAPLVPDLADLVFPAVSMVDSYDHEAVADAVATVTSHVRQSHTARYLHGVTDTSESTVLIWDEPDRTLSRLHQEPIPATYHRIREALSLIRVEGPGLGVHSVTTHIPTAAPRTGTPARRAVAGLSRAQATIVLPGGAATERHHPGQWYVADHATPGAAAPALVQAPHLDRTRLAQFLL